MATVYPRTEKDSLSHEWLVASMSYDPEAGELRWKVPRKGVKVGSVAGRVHNNSKYVTLRINYSLYMAHRLIWFYVHGEWPKFHIDHINGVTTDNRISNLRDIPQADNNAYGNNRSGKKGLFGVPGVTWHKVNRKFKVQITVNYKQKHIGCYSSVKEAYEAYVAAKKENEVPADYPPFESYNVPNLTIEQYIKTLAD